MQLSGGVVAVSTSPHRGDGSVGGQELSLWIEPISYGLWTGIEGHVEEHQLHNQEIKIAEGILNDEDYKGLNILLNFF